MSVLLNPYLNFPDGTAREALEFYASVLGGEPNIMTFGDMGTEGPLAEQVMHGQLETPDGFTIMGADAPAEMVQVTFGDNVSVSISGDDAEKMTRWFEALSEGAEITTPLEKQVWGDAFGALKDRFGISWLVNIAGSAAG
jgi:PhnB protein